MSETFKRYLIASVLCMIFLGLGFLVWASALYLADRFSCSVEVFDWIALFLCFGGFLSICIAGEKDFKGEERNQ